MTFSKYSRREFSTALRFKLAPYKFSVVSHNFISLFPGTPIIYRGRDLWSEKRKKTSFPPPPPPPHHCSGPSPPLPSFLAFSSLLPPIHNTRIPALGKKIEKRRKPEEILFLSQPVSPPCSPSGRSFPQTTWL